LLATTDCHVIVCGRSHVRAQKLVDELPAERARLSVAMLDRTRASAADISALHAFCVVDTAGPFQGASYDFVRAVIESGAHYIDLADARDFVSNFASLDAAAQAHEVLAVTGASSTPALSHAVIDEITRGWARIDDVHIAISPGNRAAPTGLAVFKSILSYVGKPVRVRLHGRWTRAPGWGLTVRRRFCDFGKRYLSLVETPDLDLVPQRFPTVRNAIFRAGLEVSIMHAALIALGLLVRAGLINSLAPFAEALRDIARLLRPLGSDCGGMIVEVAGEYADGTRLASTWQLVAEAGDGPKIPTLPALCLVRALLDGSLKRSGAMPCVGLVDLAALEREFERFAIRTERGTHKCESSPLFVRALPDFAAMPGVVRAVHSPKPASELRGGVDIDGGETWGARVLARLFGFPAGARNAAAEVTIECEGDGEVWIRRFGDSEFSSRLNAAGSGRLMERFGPLSFQLDASANANGFSLAIRCARFGDLPLPRFLIPRTQAGASVDERGRYRFDVVIEMPIVGRLVRYRGWLAPREPLAEQASCERKAPAISAPSP
jgi:saccharopine dehydrogenase-like NADP-dependent oxidoreductase